MSIGNILLFFYRIQNKTTLSSFTNYVLKHFLPLFFEKSILKRVQQLIAYSLDKNLDTSFALVIPQNVWLLEQSWNQILLPYKNSGMRKSREIFISSKNWLIFASYDIIFKLSFYHENLYLTNERYKKLILLYETYLVVSNPPPP